MKNTYRLLQALVACIAICASFMAYVPDPRKSTENGNNDNKPNKYLIYIRLSVNPDDELASSVKRQRESTVGYCEEQGYEYEIFEDYKGRNSGTSADQREGWKQLEKRLLDRDVAGVMATSLSRFHRKASNMSQLISLLKEGGKKLIITEGTLKGEHDLSKGQSLIIQIIAVIDEFFAEIGKEAAQDSIVNRKQKGITVGIPPFGTVRNDLGYLMRTIEGAWLLTNGEFQKGEKDKPPSDEGTVWRGYYKCAVRILELYSRGDLGYGKVAEKMNEEGWAFRSRDDGNWIPRQVTKDDVRRVVGNYPEYGGLVIENNKKPAKQGNKSVPGRAPLEAYFDTCNPPFDEEHAVMDVALLRQVACVQHVHSKNSGAYHGQKQEAYPYALSGITWCSHCKFLANDKNDDRYRSSLTGKTQANGKHRLRHGDHPCDCGKNSVACTNDQGTGIDDEFARLLQILKINDELLPSLAAGAEAGDRYTLPKPGTDNLRAKRITQIKQSKRKISNKEKQMNDGKITYEEFEGIEAKENKKIRRLESEKLPADIIPVLLADVINAMTDLHSVWLIATPENRKALVHAIFEYLVYDLDQQHFVDFELNPWAKRFLVQSAPLETIYKG